MAQKKTVLVDFTADWCLTCKTLEAQVLETPPVVSARAGRHTLRERIGPTAIPEVTDMLARLGSKQVPVIAIFPAAHPNRPIVFRDGYTEASLLEALKAAGASKRSDR